jgi:DHA2 family multidrug resistance protein
MDLLGLGYMIAGLGAFQLMLEEGEREDWFQSAFITRLAVISAVGIALFVWRELTTERPAVDVRILGNVRFGAATFLGGVMGAGLSGVLFILPLFLQNLLGYTAMDSGLALMPRSLAMLVMMPIAGRLYNRAGPRLLVGVGLALIAFGYWDLAHLTTDTGYWDLVWPQVWQGVGFSLLFAALSTAALSVVPRERMTAATGLYNVVRQVMGSVGIAIAATELSTSTTRYRAILVEDAGRSALAQQWLAGVTAALRSKGADVLTAQAQALALLDGRVRRQAAVLAYNHVFVLVAALFVLLRRGTPSGDVEIPVD